MNVKWKLRLLGPVAVAIFLSVGLLSGCSDDSEVTTTAASVISSTVPAADEAAGGTAGETPGGTAASHPTPDPAAGPLSAEEEEALLYLREEEKLAYDVYVTLYEKWGTKVFDNISASEVRHMASMKDLLDAYGLSDPVGDNGVGVFTNQELQDLYHTLVQQGSASESEALKAGVAVETKDIADLEALITLTDRSDVEEVAQNLLEGSRKHLAAFGKGR